MSKLEIVKDTLLETIKDAPKGCVRRSLLGYDPLGLNNDKHVKEYLL